MLTGVLTQPTRTETFTMSDSQSETITETGTNTVTSTDTNSQSETITETSSDTVTSTGTNSQSETITETSSDTVTSTDTNSQSNTITPTESISDSVSESESLLTETETFSKTLANPLLTKISSSDCTVVTDDEISCDAIQDRVYNISIFGTGFPTSYDKVTGVVMEEISPLEDLVIGSTNSPECIVTSLSKQGDVDLESGQVLTFDRITCMLNSTGIGGRFSVKILLFDGNLLSTSYVVITLSKLWDVHYWSEEYRTGTTYSSQTRISLKTESVQDGDELFLVWETENCTNPTPSRTSPVARANVSDSDSFVLFDTIGMPIGNYYICQRPLGLSYILQDRTIIILRGGIDPYRSVPCCSFGNNTMTAGDVISCDILTFDSNGNPTGAVEDECHFGFTILKDGAGNSVCAHETHPVLLPEAGHFQFQFTPYASGCLSRVGISYRGVLLSGKVLMLTILPGTPVTYKATSKCEMTSGELQCDVTKRDEHNNAVEICRTNYGNDPFVHCEKP